MKKLFSIIIISFVIVIIFIPGLTEAAESTPSPEIQKKLDDLKTAIASKAAKLKNEVSQKLTNKAYVGTVENKTENSLTVVTKAGAKIISFNQDTVFESKIKSKKKFPKNMTTGDYLAALGDIDDTGVLSAKKIILLPPTNLQPKTYLWGEIVSTSNSLVSLKDKNLKIHGVSLKKNFDLKLGDIVILTGNFNKNEVFEAGFVFVSN